MLSIFKPPSRLHKFLCFAISAASAHFLSKYPRHLRSTFVASQSGRCSMLPTCSAKAEFLTSAVWTAFLCSFNLSSNLREVSPMYETLHCEQGTSYTRLACFHFSNGSLTFVRISRRDRCGL